MCSPQTYMNLSGESVRALMDYYKLTTDEIVIIYDDISMPVGQVRIRPKGSAGGHNGIKSIIAHLGTQEFPRIKIGVGAKPENGDLVKHVLGRFSKEDDAKPRCVCIGRRGTSGHFAGRCKDGNECGKWKESRRVNGGDIISTPP